MFEKVSEPELVAKVIFEAATDTSDKIRFTAGEDAKQMSETRYKNGQESWVKQSKEMFGL